MSQYEQLRHFADSWWLLLMVIFFVGVVLWVFRPSAKKSYDEQAKIPLKDVSDDGHSGLKNGGVS